MNRTPAALYGAAGVLLWIGCKPAPEPTVFSSSGSSQRTEANAEVQLACTAYCNHVYGTATGCDEDLLATQAEGCHSFCSSQAQSVDDTCVEPVLAVYECIVEQQVPYVCDDESSSPVATESTCDDFWSTANACL